jgi:hypothetical protein
MGRICAVCDRPIRDGQHVRAVVLSVFKEIESRRAYAMEKPYDCERMEHLNCLEAVE